VKCSYDPATRGGAAPAGERVDGTIHWVSTRHAKDIEVRLYDRLFKSENPGADDRDFLLDLNPDSLKVVTAKAEPSLAEAKAGDRFQLERIGYFYGDPDSKDGAPVLNRTVSLKDGWAKQIAPKAEAAKREPKKKDDAPKQEAKVVELTADEKALRDAHGLSDDEARTLVAEPALKKLFDAAPRKEVASVLVNDVLGVLRAKKLDAIPFDASAIVELVDLTKSNAISSKQAKDVLAEMVATGKGAKAIVEAKGMKQIANADDLAPVVDAVLAENADAVGRYKAGNANVFGALVGLVMKKSKGQANPKLVTDLLKQKLS
jgi:glutaminyl-tRNA synthetase